MEEKEERKQRATPGPAVLLTGPPSQTRLRCKLDRFTYDTLISRREASPRIHRYLNFNSIQVCIDCS
jgi:hypothetical protein